MTRDVPSMAILMITTSFRFLGKEAYQGRISWIDFKSHAANGGYKPKCNQGSVAQSELPELIAQSGEATVRGILEIPFYITNGI